MVQAYARTTKTQLEPEKVYDGARQSVRSTFDAVTHALWNSKLTGSDGKSLGAPLGFVASLEDIAGEVPEARGDRQFRIYAHLQPNTIQTLDASEEFEREREEQHALSPGFPDLLPVAWRAAHLFSFLFRETASELMLTWIIARLHFRRL